jgi:hypothetical protein
LQLNEDAFLENVRTKLDPEHPFLENEPSELDLEHPFVESEPSELDPEHPFAETAFAHETLKTKKIVSHSIALYFQMK